MRNYSDVTNIHYDEENVVYFRNIQQICFYISHNAKIIDVFCDSKNKLVVVFEKATHNNLIRLWMENKPKTEV